MMKKILFILILLLSFTASLEAADYYVYCGGSGTNSGTYANPWLTISAITGLSAGDDLYFKDGSICREKLVLSVSGTGASTRSIIGCYDGDGDFDCTGKTLPIISGADTVTGSWSDLGGNEYQISFSSDVYELYDNNGSRKILAMEPDNGYFTADANPATNDLVMETADDMTYSDTQIEGGLLSCRTDIFQWNARQITDYNDSTDTITLDAVLPASSTCANNDSYVLADRDTYLDTDNEWFNDTSMNVINIIETGGAPSGTWEAVVRDYGISGSNKNFITIQDLHITKSYYAGIYLYYSDTSGNDYEIKNVIVDYIGTYKYISNNDDRRHSIGIDVFMGSAGTPPTNTIDALIDGITVDDCVRGGVSLRGNKCESGDWCDLKNSTITDIGIPTTEFFSPHSTSSKGVYLGGNWETRYWKLDNVTVDNTGAASVYWSMNFHLTNSNITNCIQDTHMGDIGCLYNHQDGDALIEYTTINGMAGTMEPRAGIYLDGDLGDVTIDHVTIKNVVMGIFANGGSSNTVTNTTICDYTDSGIYIFEKVSTFGQITGWILQNNQLNSSLSFDYHLKLWSDEGSGNPVTDWFATDAVDYNEYYPDSPGDYFAWDENGGTSPSEYDFAGWDAIRADFEDNSSVSQSSICFPSRKVILIQ